MVSIYYGEYSLVGQHLYAVFCHHEGMLPLGRWFFIACDNLPSVWIVRIDEHLPGTHVDHWFDGEYHTRNEQHTGTLMTVVKHLWLFVELAIRPGMNTQEIDDICMQYCKDHNAIPACLNYEGYPKSVCTSPDG